MIQRNSRYLKLVMTLMKMLIAKVMFSNDLDANSAGIDYDFSNNVEANND